MFGAPAPPPVAKGIWVLRMSKHIRIGCTTAAVLLLACAGAAFSDGSDGEPDGSFEPLPPDLPLLPMEPMGDGDPPIDPPTDIPIWPVAGPTIDPRPPVEAPHVVPEPLSASLMIAGAALLAAARRRRKRK